MSFLQESQNLNCTVPGSGYAFPNSVTSQVPHDTVRAGTPGDASSIATGSSSIALRLGASQAVQSYTVSSPITSVSDMPIVWPALKDCHALALKGFTAKKLESPLPRPSDSSSVKVRKATGQSTRLSMWIQWEEKTSTLEFVLGLTGEKMGGCVVDLSDLAGGKLWGHAIPILSVIAQGSAHNLTTQQILEVFGQLQDYGSWQPVLAMVYDQPSMYFGKAGIEIAEATSLLDGAFALSQYLSQRSRPFRLQYMVILHQRMTSQRMMQGIREVAMYLVAARGM
jgi:hypothetical protein